MNLESTTVNLTKKGKPRKRKPKTQNVYFTKVTENAILEYVATENDGLRNKIYNKHIEYAFFKLTENIINTYKMHYTDGESIEDHQHDTIVFLLQQLKKYKPEKGAAYSYFGTIAKRYLIQKNKKNYAKLQEMVRMEYEDDETKERITELQDDTYHHDLDEGVIKFFQLYIKYIDENLYRIFPKPKDAQTADAILQLFKNCHSLEILDNKKAVYIYIREMIDVDTLQITKIIKKFKQIYIKLYNRFYEHEMI